MFNNPRQSFWCLPCCLLGPSIFTLRQSGKLQLQWQQKFQFSAWWTMSSCVGAQWISWNTTLSPVHHFPQPLLTCLLAHPSPCLSHTHLCRSAQVQVLFLHVASPLIFQRANTDYGWDWWKVYFWLALESLSSGFNSGKNYKVSWLWSKSIEASMVSFTSCRT